MSESYCPFCGSVIKANDEFCGNCGASINAPATPSAPPAYSQPSQPNQQPYQQPGQGQQPYSSAPTGQQYGATTQTMYAQPGAQPQQNKAADKSLVFALIGLFIIPFIGGLLAIIFGVQGLSNPYNRNKAVIGIVLGILEIIGYGILAFFRFF